MKNNRILILIDSSIDIDQCFSFRILVLRLIYPIFVLNTTANKLWLQSEQAVQ